jgi:chromosome segregation ATPase
MVRVADRERMTSQASSTQSHLDRDAQIRKLTECDEDLSRLGTDVNELLHELGRLRTDGSELARRLGERDARLQEQQDALSRFERERSQLRQEVAAASEALLAAESRLAEHDQQVTGLESQLEALQAGIAERESGLADAEAQLSLMQRTLAERDQALERERVRATTAAQELTDLRRRSDGLQRELEATTALQVSAPAGSESAFRQVGGELAKVSPAQEQAAGHLRLVAAPEGYRLSVSEERCPSPGEQVEIAGQRFLVLRTGRAPLPHDGRRCAFLVAEPR